MTGYGRDGQDAKTPLKTRLKAGGEYNYRFTASRPCDSFPSVPLGGWGLLPGCRHRVAYHFEEVIRRWHCHKSRSKKS